MKNRSTEIDPLLSGVIHAFSTILELRDPYTAGHQQRVAEMSYVIGGKLGLCEDKLIGLRIAGLLHDIGKIVLPMGILSKPGKLLDVEFALIKEHPKTGYEILRSIWFPWSVAQMVLQHHERISGTGYPYGITGDKILPESKILAVADVFEAMTAKRAYRTALSKEAAIEELTQNKGILYDADIVDACVELFGD